MPRPFTREQRRDRLRKLLARLDREHSELSDLVDRVLRRALPEFRRALAEFRRLNAEPVPAHVRARKETPGQAAERGFKVGFLLAAATFWDDTALGQERRRTAQNAGRQAAAQKSERTAGFERAVAKAARAYAPGTHVRAMAREIAAKLKYPGAGQYEPDRIKSPAAVRHVLAKLKK